MAKKIIRHELVEIIIPKASTLKKFLFPDIPNLRNVHLWGLQVYTVDALTKSPISTNGLCTHTSVLHESFITLVNYGGKEFGKQMPAVDFNTLKQQLNTGTNWSEEDFKNFVGQKVNWPKSYVEFTAAPADANNDLSYLVSVYYSLPIAEEKQESAFSFNNKG